MDNVAMDVAQDAVATPTEQVAQTERMIPQSQVNSIVGNAKREAAERAVEEYKRQNAQQAPRDVPESYSSRSMSEDDIRRFTETEIKRHFSQIEEDARERANSEAANRIVGMFREKISSGKDRYEDFDSVTGNVAMQHYPNVVQLLAEHVDNSADVLYHLAKNRTRLYELESTCSHNAPDAIYEIKRLSDSIKANEQTAQVKQPNAPLSQNRASHTGMDSGALSMADLKRKYRG